MSVVRRLAMALLLMWATPALAQFSPGDLAEPHSKLEGISNCTKCHEEGKQLSAPLCLDCHTDVRKRVASRSGFHGKLGQSDREQCQNCHKDHKGTSFKLIDWGRGINQFDHNRTGYPLRGKHAQAKCQTCHESKRIVDSAISAALAKDPKRQTWLGVGKSCTTCHFDEHRGQEGKDCERCHNELAWKPAPKFDHQKTAFLLRGKHQGVPCKSCHRTEPDPGSHPPFPVPLATSFTRFAPLAHTRCLDCHDDPHRGKFSRNCESCHTVDGWTTLKKSTERDFHEKTNYPLRGAHKTAACTDCHGPWPGQPARFRGLAFGKCTDCHTDAHNGQLKGACDTCHDVEHFTPAKYELEDHQKTRYPLDGAHAAVACTTCHLPAGTTSGSKPASVAAATKPAGKPTSRGKAKPHERASHPPHAVVVAASSWRFTQPGDLARCESCHRDPHAGQLTHVTDGCRHCHTTTSFSPASFNHQESRFALTGKHQQVGCAACHTEGIVQGNKTTRYRPLDQSCQGCHRDPHVGQFKQKPCETCHATTGWKPVQFRHDDPQQTRFVLDGKHRQVKCEGCHKEISVGGVKTLRYRPLPTACEGCHEDFHKGDFRGFQP